MKQVCLGHKHLSSLCECKGSGVGRITNKYHPTFHLHTLVVTGRDSSSWGCVFESRPQILGGYFFTYIVAKIFEGVSSRRNDKKWIDVLNESSEELTELVLLRLAAADVGVIDVVIIAVETLPTFSSFFVESKKIDRKYFFFDQPLLAKFFVWADAKFGVPCQPVSQPAYSLLARRTFFKEDDDRLNRPFLCEPNEIDRTRSKSWRKKVSDFFRRWRFPRMAINWQTSKS